jgi:hypothetical protein
LDKEEAKKCSYRKCQTLNAGSVWARPRSTMVCMLCMDSFRYCCCCCLHTFIYHWHHVCMKQTVRFCLVERDFLQPFDQRERETERDLLWLEQDSKKRIGLRKVTSVLVVWIVSSLLYFTCCKPIMVGGESAPPSILLLFVYGKSVKMCH